MTRAWPWPKDTASDRYRRIIDSYRTALQQADPMNCRLIDARMAEFGQEWISSSEPIDMNVYKTAPDIAAQFGLEAWNIHDWSRRHPDKFSKRKIGSRVLFRVGDVIAYQATMRRR